MNSLLDSKHQARLLRKWAPILESGKAIESDSTKLALAQVLENTRNFFARKGLIKENGYTRAQVTGGDGSTDPIGKDGSKGVLKGKFGFPNRDDYGDFFMPNVVMPMLRRIFPDLIANELVGVQALNGPIGFALALRAKYDVNRRGLDLSADPGAPAPSADYEIGYNSPIVDFTGAKDGEVPVDPQEKVKWTDYVPEDDPERWDGRGADVNERSEYASLANGTYPKVGFELIKTGVEAKTRKLGAEWSPELAEDMEAMHGIDVEQEMVNILSYEIGAEIDRQIITEMVKAAITGGSTSVWDPTVADGLDQMGRLATLLTHITIEANQIALKTRRGNANFVITSPRVTALLEQMTMNKFVSFAGGKSIPSVPYSGVGAIQKQGLINDGQQLLVRDAFARKDYVLMGYKGQHPGDSGIIYCPYIPVQLSKVQRPDTFTPAVGARTRYGIMSSPWDARRYYHFIKVTGLYKTRYEGVTGERYFVAKEGPSTLPEISK